MRETPSLCYTGFTKKFNNVYKLNFTKNDIITLINKVDGILRP